MMTDPYYTDDAVTLYAGDCLDVLPTLPDASVDAVVTDPPYGLEFMGKEWDRFRVDEPTSGRHRGDRAGAQGTKGTTDQRWTGADGRSMPSSRVNYGGGKRPTTNQCTGCGKRDQFRNPHTCPAGTAWESILLNPHAAPPSSLAFQAWCQLWAAECLRVLKPGGHLLAFGGTRTWHRLAVAIEDAGFEIRDTIAWLYGSGFPKSLDVSKAIDRARNEDLEPVDAVRTWLNQRRVAAGFSHDAVNKHFGHASNGGGSSSAWMTNPTSRSLPTWDQWLSLKALFGFGDDMDGEVWRLNGRKGKPGDNWDQREVVGQSAWDNSANHFVPGEDHTQRVQLDITAPATADARRWQGWGTALKPAHEPVVCARKPLSGTVAANVLAHGTGALNVDGCRIASGDSLYRASSVAKSPDASQRHDGYDRPWKNDKATIDAANARTQANSAKADVLGRWPANVALDETAAAALDRMSGEQRDGVAVNRNRDSEQSKSEAGWGHRKQPEDVGYGQGGGASRFFYTAKAGSDERITVPRADSGEARILGKGLSDQVRECRQCGNRTIKPGATSPACGHDDFAFVPTKERSDRIAHPTVKPLALMRWLVRLVTPPGGLILDPFAGSGTTIEAAIIEGFRCIAIEREPDYLPLITQRINRRRDPIAYLTTAGEDLGLFGDSST